VNHPGCFLIDFSQDDTQFTMLANVKHMATGATPRPWQTMITLPAGVRCDSCTLRLRQVMLGSEAQACPPAGGIPADTTYYSCANVVIADTAPDGGAMMPVDASAPRDSGAPDKGAATPDASGAGGSGGGTGSGGAAGMGGMAPAAGGSGGGTSTEAPMTTAPAATKHGSGGGCSVATRGAPGAGVLLLMVAAAVRRRRRQGVE
jgi:MYXO-CTERM domain-containing protein